MLMIRLQRVGKKKQPTYRLVVSEKTKDLYGDQLEIVGNYNPVSQPKTVSLKAERIKYWLGVGAQTSPTVWNLLAKEGVVEGKKVKAWRPKKSAKGGSASGRKDELAKPAVATE